MSNAEWFAIVVVCAQPHSKSAFSPAHFLYLFVSVSVFSVDFERPELHYI